MQDLRKKYRHKYEILIFTISYIASFVVFFILVFLGANSIKNVKQREMLEKFIEDDLNLMDIIVHVGGFIAIIIIIITLIILLVKLFEDKLKAEADDIHVSENQFKDLLDAEKEFAKKLAIEEIPKIYICTNYDKEIEVKGAEFDSVHWVRINYEEVFNKPEIQCDIAKFTIAKKLAYIYMGYYNKSFLIFTIFSNWIPLISRLVDRVTEYTTDKIAMDLVGEKEAIRSIIALKTGFYIMSFLNVDEYIKNIENIKENKHLFWINVMRAEPITAYRLDALLNKKDGKLF